MNRSASEKRDGHAEEPLPFDLSAIRTQFPILKETVRGKRLAYLDNAATTQKPEAMLQALDHYYRTSNANVHRAVHELAERATTAYEGARDRIAAFIKSTREEVVFTRGTPEIGRATCRERVVHYGWVSGVAV